MYTVGLDIKKSLILYSQLNKTNIEPEITKNKIKNDLSMNEILFGCLLGDGKMEMAPRAVNARFGFTQSESKKDYFLSVCYSVSSGKYWESSYNDKRTGKTYKSLSFWTRSLPIFNDFYQMFYVDKVKVVPEDLSLLTPLALAHWIMQDGSRGTSKGLYICTDNFSYVDVKRLSLYLKDKYGIRTSVHKAGKNYRVYILAKSVNTVENLVLPFFHKSMLYKLGI